MKIRTIAAASAALALAGLASSASALTIAATENWNLNGALLFGQTYIQDYDNPLAANFAYVGDNPYSPVQNTYVRSGPALLANESAPPPTSPDNGATIGRDPTRYQTVETGGLASIEALHNTYLNSFSFYMGSPDTYNHIKFRVFSNNALLTTLTGTDIWDGSQGEADGDQDWGKRVYYDFEGAKVTKIEFTSTGNSFEFDGLAAAVAVPEPSTWALMIMGFGGAGAMIRRRKAIMA
ncbi:MAG TPA: PEPxxWA-CTERM sorting domain-containing protein [Phenylobacterium sp.]